MFLPTSDSQHGSDEGAAPGSAAAPGEVIATLLAQIAAQQEVIAALIARVAELERQLGLNSGNSGKPPSSDGLKKKPPRTQSLREKSGKKTGGQQGHPGKTLCRSYAPDTTIDHFPTACSSCGGTLEQTEAVGFTARQVFDLPEPQPLVVTEHRAHAAFARAAARRPARRSPKRSPRRCNTARALAPSCCIFCTTSFYPRNA